jgi:hypothetical protein
MRVNVTVKISADFEGQSLGSEFRVQGDRKQDEHILFPGVHRLGFRGWRGDVQGVNDA